ncbi:MAG: bleomycin resistance family protein [Candidatus Acidiferrum sp.]
MNEFECVVPILNVKNFAASMDYYQNKLGFRKKWDWGDPPTFGCVVRGKVEIFLCEGAQGQPGTWMSIFMDDVDALHEEYRSRGAIIRLPPTNMPWGVREMNVEDPDGHRFRLGSHSTGPVDEDVLERFSKLEQFGQ